MAQGIKLLIIKLDNLSLASGIHMVEGKKKQLHKLFSDFHICAMTFTQAHIYTNTHTHSNATNQSDERVEYIQ